MKLVGVTILLVFILSLGVCGFWFARWINWQFGYERMVENKIVAMVKPEALKAKEVR